MHLDMWISDKQIISIVKNLVEKNNGVITDDMMMLYKTNKNIQDVYYGTQDKQFKDAGGWVPEEGYDPTIRPWYQAGINSDSAVMTDAYIDKITNKMVVSIVTRVKDSSGMTIGVVGEDISLDGLSEIVKKINMGGKGYGFIVDQNGIIIAHPKKELVGTNGLENEATKDIITRMLDLKTGTANQVTVTNGAGTITLSTPQDIATTSSPTFASPIISGDITLSNGAFDNEKVGDTLAMHSSTGVRSGAAMTVNGGDPTKFDIASGVGYIVNYATPSAPTINRIAIGPFTAQTVTNLASADFTWVMINSAGAIVQQTSTPTPTQRRQNIVLGRLNHSNRTNISFANTFPDFEFSPISQFGDLVDSLGPFNVSGNLISANGANLSMNKSAGTMFHKSFNYSSNTNSPHVISTAVLTPVTFAYQNQTGSPGTYITVLDPTKYDNAGTTTTVPSSNNATVQRVYLFGSNTLRVQRGQAVYATFASALQGYAQENFVESPLVSGFSVPLAYIIMTKSCTSLLNPACSKIIPAAKFGGSTGGAGSGGTTTFQQAYNNSVQPQITVDSTQLGVQIRDASTPIGSSLFAVQDNEVGEGSGHS